MKSATFEEVVSDQTSKYTKIPKEEYLPAGEYKIIDQGQQFIGGYTNRKDLINASNLPVIVFGDHTKIFKFIDFPFTIGADGTKVLSVKRELADTKYVYYFLKSLKLPVAGYSRHFKFLKGKRIPLPQINDQIHIANVLSRCEELMCKRKESLRLLDEFLKSTFLEMFGDPVRNEKGWKKVRLSEICSKIGSGATPRGGKESYKSEGIKLIRSMNVHNNTFIFDGLVFIDEAQASKLDHVIVKPNDVLLNITGASVGRCCLAPKEVVPARVNQHVSIIRPDSNVINPVFLSRVLTNTHFQAQIVKEAKLKGATREAITKEEIERMEVPLPNKRFQSLFATIVEKTELLRARQQHSLKELSTLYGSLSQRAFQGELDLREEPLANAAEPEVVYHKARK